MANPEGFSEVVLCSGFGDGLVGEGDRETALKISERSFSPLLFFGVERDDCGTLNEADS